MPFSLKPLPPAKEIETKAVLKPENAMKCHVCGGGLEAVVTDMPFKTSQQSIVILKEMPVLQCENCGEYLIEDTVMERVEKILAKVEQGTELEIVRYAA